MNETPFLETFWRNINDSPRRIFLRTPDRSVSYRQLSDAVRRTCAAFDQHGAAAGDRVLIVSANEAVAGMAFLAALLDGAVPVMLSPDSSPDRVISILDSVRPALAVLDESTADSLPEAELAGMPVLSVPEGVVLESGAAGKSGALRSVSRLLGREGMAPRLKLPADGREPRLPQATEPTAYILFTSGTTSTPSGVCITRRSLAAHLRTLNRLFEYGAGSRIFNATPLAHTDGLVQGLLLAAYNGGALLRPGRFELPRLEEWLDCLSRFEATHFITNPTVLTLIDRFAGHDDYFAHDGFFGVLSSASTLRPALWKRFESRFSCSLYNMYGMTETVANATYAGRHPEMGPVGSIGVPVDCEVRLSDPAAPAEDSDHDEGELQLRGENIFEGYWNNQERTAETLLEGGWMRTGDLARRRADGGLDIVGRIKTMINMGGQSIMPEEIDEVLARHPAVEDVATVGLSDPEFEEIAVAAVALGGEAGENDLLAHCRGELEALKVPKRIIALPAIPRGDAGKPRIGELRRILERSLGESHETDSGAKGAVSPEDIFRLAAEIFHVPVEDLSGESSPKTVKGWDSFNQLNLMIEAESRFGVRIPAARVASIRTLGDLYRIVSAQS